ncbi:dicarboxylate/amino acid:cation symporter [Clostridium beijerinckii]|uniref:Dicarboxylate/amino acid:cation symporter n=3 Tax=Clostridium TaxID=1485 RepID=A0A1S8QWA5_CLOBE|nr:dicarboxylate/amino acid:cation symporter [Clostridium beijerinckii]ABR33489.1 sodium:dicarboxylate symporter [Clostridium beijerinckii NCIMB 8052]AIU03871.1 sodium:dicarboxylate symporter [Clostridium beijerinckii ATCC 35702]MBF7811611.1 dicarboxylate/amino acid:cation symporter [Clostridium beijerinckii]MCI1477544.1 dicarboxylate/amino acid:cation symporter [Clostridium beijerinckii]MCI1577322.1 dicarboxylate/amino acid:cation symporter [Clostridium beijerinckii]
MRFLKNYKSSLILVLSILLGGAIGIIMGDKAKIFAPLGNLFLNLIFTMLVPIVFFSIASAIANMDKSKRLGRIFIITLITFGITAIISGIIGVISFKMFNPAVGLDPSMFNNLMTTNSIDTPKSVGVLEKIVSSISVGDFSELLSRNNLLALILFSILIGFGTMISKEQGKAFASFLSSGATVTMKVVNIIMYYAPIGLGAYFANVIGQLGGQILSGYAKIFILYLVVSIIYFFVFFSIYAYIASRKEGVKLFWKNAAEPSITALATCSSAACIPVNIKAAKNMGVSDTLANIIMPLGVNIHKDGSVIGGIYKIMFLFAIFGRDINTISSLFPILGAGLLIGAVVGAVPGGGAIGEMLILSIFGFPQEALAIMLVIATIIDAPATLLNSSGNTVCTMIISKFIDKK